MLEIFLTENKDVHKKLEILIARRLGADFEITRTVSGKPYIADDPLFFSLSHTGNYAMIAISDRPVGIDAEMLKERKLRSVTARFTERERHEICGKLTSFYANWTVKEAYIKLIGGTLAYDLKRLEYFCNNLYYNGEKVNCGYALSKLNNGDFLYAVCADGYSAKEIAETPVKLFQLKKGEKI